MAFAPVLDLNSKESDATEAAVRLTSHSALDGITLSTAGPAYPNQFVSSAIIRAPEFACSASGVGCCAQLERANVRADALEARVNALEASNVELQAKIASILNSTVITY